MYHKIEIKSIKLHCSHAYMYKKKVPEEFLNECGLYQRKLLFKSANALHENSHTISLPTVSLHEVFDILT